MMQLYTNKEIEQIISEKVRAEINTLAQNIIHQIEAGKILVPKECILIDISDETPIDDLEWSVRTSNCLHNANILTVGSLCSHTESKLLTYRNLGSGTVSEIKYQLRKYGRTLKKGN